MGSRSQGSMASVRVFLYSAVLYLASASSCHNYGDWGCSPRSRHVVPRGHHHHYGHLSSKRESMSPMRCTTLSTSEGVFPDQLSMWLKTPGQKLFMWKTRGRKWS